ncbi:MAG TPA: carbonic anhydrase [Legionellales bacterium]|nr:carbonic anhydrase [Legionellales bacterium]|tara:strand:- start:159 stop:2441 length:2283 start_codon:yes stop_codon:yes gene_type:complete
MHLPYSTDIPLTKQTFFSDTLASLVVFLIALPLYLSLAWAAGVPWYAGIISGMVGGLVVGLISQSQVSITGPSVALSAIVITAIHQLHHVPSLMLAIMLAGILQLCMGYLRVGFIADYLPSNVIEGLLCAVGMLLILKHIPWALTFSPNFISLKAQLIEGTNHFTFTPLNHLFYQINLGAVIITGASIFVLYLLKIKRVKLTYLSIPLIFILIGLILNEFFIFTHSAFIQTQPFLINLPANFNMYHFLAHHELPNWQAWQNPYVYLFALLIAFSASIESLFNLKASEKLDKKKRYCSKSRELIAQGMGNITSGLLGGLPVATLVSQTAVNIEARACSRYAARIYGLLFLATLMIWPYWLNKIPLASIAMVLMYVGYQLTKPIIFKNYYHQGMDRFIPFIVTFISILAFNILVGTVIGLVCSLFIILKHNSQTRLDVIKEQYPSGTTYRLLLPQHLSFLKRASFMAELYSIPSNTQLIIDARYSDFIDKEIIELIEEFRQEHAPLKAIALNLIGFKPQYAIHDYIDFINITTYDAQTSVRAFEVLRLLKEGNMRFIEEKRINRSPRIDVHYTAPKQYPMGIILGCIDSRVPVETIFDMGVGDLFCARVAGNVMNDDMLASIEYACHVAGAKLIVVLGHTRCGAVQAACDHVQTGHITQLLAKLNPVLAAETTFIEERTSQNTQFVQRITTLNVAHTVNQLYERSDILKNAIQKNEIGIVGAIYDVETGCVQFGELSDALHLFNAHPPLIEQMEALCHQASH